MDRIREWETGSQGWAGGGGAVSCDRFLYSYAVRKVEEEGELPGLMIEEMMESASMVDRRKAGGGGQSVIGR